MTDATPANHAVATARYAESRVGTQRVVTAFLDGKMVVTDDGNPSYNTIIERLEANDTDGLVDLFSAEATVSREFQRVSERVLVRGGHVYFDGDPIEGTLSDHLIRLVKDGEDVTYLVNFWERIANNPDDHSREHLMRWLAAEDFSITRDGYILGYKGLRDDRTSIHAGPGIVNGVEQNGYLDNSEGNVVEIARSSVTVDHSRGCAFGLHVGTYGYASSFGQVVVEVLVDPRDVVSVPTDCSDQKMRVCRYTVGKDSTGRIDRAVVDEVIDSNFDDDFSVEYGSDWTTF